MSTKELDIINQGPKRYEFSSLFDGSRFYLLFEYNDRNDTWYLTLKDTDREVIVQGIPLLTNVDNLISRYVIDDIFLTGDILVADSQQNKRDPSYENFGDEVSAFYTSIIS